jgi:hypothetical protein
LNFELQNGAVCTSNEELHNLLSSPNIIKLIKSIRMNWKEHVVVVDGDNNKIDLKEYGLGLWTEFM